MLGGVAATVLMAAYAAGLVIKGRGDVLRALSYNAPIAFLFLVLATDLALRLLTWAWVKTDVWTALIWGVAGVLLFLRLGTKTIEVSGHMVWLPLLTTQAWLYGFPRWFMVTGVASLLWALGLKLFVFGGPSGVPGTLVGIALAAVLLFLHRFPRRRPDPTAC